MSYFASLAATIWRNYVTGGNPASGAHEPDKSEIRAYFLTMEEHIDRNPVRVTAGGTVNVGDKSREYQVEAAVVSALTFNMPLSTARNGVPCTIADVDGVFATYNATIVATSGDSINGAATLVLSSNRQVVTLWPRADGAGYYIG